MSNHIYMMEFETVEGTTLLQRVDRIDTILETTIPAKAGAPARKVFHLLLANNNRVQVVNETRESILRRMRNAQGLPVIVVEGDPKPEAASE